MAPNVSPESGDRPFCAIVFHQSGEDRSLRLERLDPRKHVPDLSNHRAGGGRPRFAECFKRTAPHRRTIQRLRDAEDHRMESALRRRSLARHAVYHYDQGGSRVISCRPHLLARDTGNRRLRGAAIGARRNSGFERLLSRFQKLHFKPSGRGAESGCVLQMNISQRWRIHAAQDGVLRRQLSDLTERVLLGARGSGEAARGELGKCVPDVLRDAVSVQKIVIQEMLAIGEARSQRSDRFKAPEWPLPPR